MTTEEFSSEFDVLYNSITSNQAPGLDSYEKSVFLTKAQDEIIKAYFNPKGNKLVEGFDGGRKRQADFSNLIKVTSLYPKAPKMESFDSRSLIYVLPRDFFIPINEALYDEDTRKTSIVTPLTFGEYDRLMSRPFKYPRKGHVWRLFTTSNESVDGIVQTVECQHTNIEGTFINKTSNPIVLHIWIPGGSSKVEVYEDQGVISIEACAEQPYPGETDAEKIIEFIDNVLLNDDSRISKYLDVKSIDISLDDGVDELLFNIDNPEGRRVEIIGPSHQHCIYKLRYVRTPKPIIVDNLEYNSTINGLSTKSECELPSEIHPEILQRAVEMAKSVYMGDLTSQLALGQASQTNVGTVMRSE